MAPASDREQHRGSGQAAGRLALRQAVGDPDDPGGREHEPDHVELPRLLDARLIVREQTQGHEHRKCADRDVDQEDPLPPGRLEQQSTERRAEHRGQHDRDPDQAHDLGEVARTGGLDQDHLPDRCQHAAADALDHPEGDQLTAVGGQRTQRGAGREHDQGDQVETPGAVAPHGPAGDRDHGGQRQQVSGDHPLDLTQRRMQVSGKIVQRDVDDRRIEHRHDRAEDDHDRDPLDVGFDAGGCWLGCGRSCLIHLMAKC